MSRCHVMPVKDSIRCKIHNLIPANGEKEWSSNAYQVFEMIREDGKNQYFKVNVYVRAFSR